MKGQSVNIVQPLPVIFLQIPGRGIVVALRSQANIKIPCGIFKISGNLLRYNFRISGLRLDLDIVDPHAGTL